jgi:membrane protein required for colicin V production
MVETSLNLFDLGVLIVVGLSALLSFFRGFVREILSLGAWMGASVITLYMFPTASKFIEPQVKSAVIASGLASIGVFFIALILISVVTGLLLKFVKTGAEVGLLDNMVGLMFGIARGVLIVAIAYFVMTIVIVEKDYPDWVKQSKSRPYIAEVSHGIAKIAPSYLRGIIDKDKENKEGSEDATPSGSSKSKVIRLEDAKPANGGIELPSIEDLQERIREENEKMNESR